MKNKYIAVAKRSTNAANALLASGTHEKAGFMAYHAFESSGCALGAHMGRDMGKGVSHAKKLKIFQDVAKSVGLSKPVSQLCVRLGSMRNRFLYPELLPDGTIMLPQDQITSAKTKELLKQVEHMVKTVELKL